MFSRDSPAARLLVASGISAAVVVSAPLLGQVRAALLASFPRQFVLIVGSAVGFASALLAVLAVSRIRVRRAARIAALACAIGVAVAYSAATRTGIPVVDAVERVHFIEYGVLTFLFYRAWRSNADISVVVLPVLAAFLVATLDEWFQWFVPNRVGEVRDLVLNLVAIACGALASIAVDPPPRVPVTRLEPASGASVRGLTTAAVLVFAGFVDAVHLGHVVADEDIGTFRSHDTRDGLLAESKDRALRWQMDPPLALRRFSREDQYLDEGRWHIHRRNALASEGQLGKASRENLILERYFAPVLDTPTYAVPTRSRWNANLRDAATAQAVREPERYVSMAQPYPIVVWPRSVFWAVVALLVAAIWLVRRPRGVRAPSSSSCDR